MHMNYKYIHFSQGFSLCVQGVPKKIENSCVDLVFRFFLLILSKKNIKEHYSDILKQDSLLHAIPTSFLGTPSTTSFVGTLSLSGITSTKYLVRIKPFAVANIINVKKGKTSKLWPLL